MTKDKYDLLIEGHNHILNQTLPTKVWAYPDGTTYQGYVRSGEEYDAYMECLEKYLIFVTDNFPTNEEDFDKISVIIKCSDADWYPFIKETLLPMTDTEIQVFVVSDLIRKKVPNFTRSEGFKVFAKNLANCPRD